MPLFLFFPPILDCTEDGAFFFCDFLEYCPRGEKKFAPFSYVCFPGGSFHPFWCTWTCYECSKCLYCRDTKFWVVLFAFCIMSINFHWLKSGMSCSPAVMYSVCKPTVQKLPNQSQFMLSLPLCLQSIHNNEFETNLLHLHTRGSCSPLSECSLGIHSMFSLLFLTVNVHHRQPQKVMDFSLFLLPLYLLWDNFLISEMTSIRMNNTTKKTHFW